jgi:hypothetical protein
MYFTSLDTITRSMLLQKGLPLHYYVQFLKYSADCVRELSYDSMRAVSTATLPISQQDFAADLPCDYVEWIKVGVPQGQFIQPLVQRESINRLTNYTAQGVPTTYGNAQTVDLDFPFWPGYWMFQNIDDLGENVGRLFGYNTAFSNNYFKVIPERGQIQFAETLQQTCCVLEYISSGQTVSNATKIDPLCQAAVEAYAEWKWKQHGRKSSPGEVDVALQMYKIELRRFRARKDNMTPWDIRQTIYKNYIGASKT